MDLDHPQLTRIIDEFEAARVRLHDLVDALPEERWAERADPERWSVAECVAHLNLTTEAYLPVMREALERARESGRAHRGRYRRSPLGWFLTFAVGPLPRLGRLRLGRVRAPAAFVPGGELPRGRVMADFDRLQDEQIELVRAADGLPIDRVKIASPFQPSMSYDLYSAFRILPRHQARHLQQAEGVWSR